MSLQLTVAISVRHFDRTVIEVERSEGVLPVNLFDPSCRDQFVTEQDVELFDLARATLARLIAEVAEKADAQAGELRELLLRALGAP